MISTIGNPSVNAGYTPEIGIHNQIHLGIEQQRLPEEIIGNGQWVVADMDGTLIGEPGYKKEPTLDQSIAKEAIVNWLAAGGNLLVLTGGLTERSIERFGDYIPEELRSNRQLILGSNGGGVLCYYEDGEWIEDKIYQQEALEGGTLISETKADDIIDYSILTINEFFQELRCDPDLLHKKLSPEDAEKFQTIVNIALDHEEEFSKEELMTLNSDTVPRIEVRKTKDGNGIVQIVVIGIPAGLNVDLQKFGITEDDNLQVVRVTVSHQISVSGVDKSLALTWLPNQPEGYPTFSLEKSFAIGDKPESNDRPLTQEPDLKFISVSKKNAEGLDGVSYHVGNNEEGTKKVIEGLLQEANDMDSNQELEPVIPTKLESVIFDVTHY